MSNDPVEKKFDASGYQLPQQDWQCGHQCDGHPCAIGPDGNGDCIVEQICTPVLSGSGWQCTRAKVFGGRCKDGPIPDANHPLECATCPCAPSVCQPQRTLRSKRRLVSGVVAAAAFGLCLVLVGGASGDKDSLVDTSSFVSPGPLTAYHATLEQGCAACHSSADLSAIQLVNCAFGEAPGSDRLADSRKCLSCHQGFGPDAMHPHSVSAVAMKDKTKAATTDSSGHTMTQTLTRAVSSVPSTSTGELACSTCHVEHQGVAFNLSELTNDQCQSCHSSGFHSFIDGHPEFRPRKRAFLHFNHSTHLQRHFSNDPAGVSKSCSDCHIQDADGSSMILASYDNMCASCHSLQVADDAMPTSLRMKGTAFVALGDEQAMPPFMKMLLDADSKSGTDVSAGRTRLLRDLNSKRELAVVARLKQVSNSGIPLGLIRDVADRLAESGFFVAVQSSSDGALNDEVPTLPPGAWSIEESGTVLAYRSRGHADPMLRDLLNLAAVAASQYPDPPTAGSAGEFDRLFRQLAAPEATGHCMKCHTVDALPSGTMRINWQSRQVPTADSGFTKFSHGPHVTLLNNYEQAESMGVNKDNRCETCHAVAPWDPSVLRLADFITEEGLPHSEFSGSDTLGLLSVSKSSCVKCHTQERAGDGCMQCHNYHVHDGQVGER